jgi:hypothetical protein
MHAACFRLQGFIPRKWAFQDHILTLHTVCMYVLKFADFAKGGFVHKAHLKSVDECQQTWIHPFVLSN